MQSNRKANQWVDLAIGRVKVWSITRMEFQDWSRRARICSSVKLFGETIYKNLSVPGGACLGRV